VDDDSGWNDVLVGGWHAGVRDAVVVRVERRTFGRHGQLVRTLHDPEAARFAWVEILHRHVVAAIREETGADLDALGSQAAWACYEQVWDGLRTRWADGGRLARVPLGREPVVVNLLMQLPAAAAEAAGADVSGQVADPLWVDGRLLVDVHGLRAHVHASAADADVRTVIARILAACNGQ
jgi:hypothetical protein